MSLFRPNIDRIEGYVPGEQPQTTDWVKLNTNENPYPPSPRVFEAIQAAATDRLRLYPDPIATEFRTVAAELFGVDADWVLPANGSDENLTIIIRSFVDPGELVVSPYPSYILYETLVEIQGGRHRRLPLNADWSWDMQTCRPLIEQAKLALVPNPNSPSGNRWSLDEIAELIPPQGMFVLDEAYGDFPDQPHCGEIFSRPAGERVIVTRSFSKSYSLAGIRMGFAVAHPDVITGMRKVKDSYNCDGIALAAATAALRDQQWMLENTAKIQKTRAILSATLVELGFNVVNSQANFVWATHPQREHREIFEALKQRNILVRFMTYPDVTYQDKPLTGLRVTIGTDEQNEILSAALREIV
ncbi:Histidinol-phosphate aminotransferase [Symmachiella dynata]|uniref:Histidinol-phosphate aminotransferase n=1 Tax=Symmachiella dynata TaxID=2527995 RepID=A0A517ZKW3_9PLAN|nr:histidinol-phosphate transaminase [Symmachiella dynata]QDU43140.1 Histidinol-phosphate aminotransferase [Symmachiella dynata]